MAMDESGSIENSPGQLKELSDERLKEIIGSSRHGHNNKRWAMDILTERRLERLEKSLAVIAEDITANPGHHAPAAPAGSVDGVVGISNKAKG